MKDLKLIDRVVVEIRKDSLEELSAFELSMLLRSIADAIELGRKSNCSIHKNGVEVLWEHECPRYGGFKIVSDKSLISQYYYGSEPKPFVVSEEVRKDIEKWREQYDINDGSGLTDGDLVDIAFDIFDKITWEVEQ